ncbi:methyltransferase domain-containing protein [Psychroflexus aestuariivivens]|uniref:methyltransferase n=1 Tax=Psychroflexus aestuariivivens TaxID=1795040 RepID=UPI000FD8003C|nr:methyltransferase [Psychroflexus aestuariivivens]
MYEKTYPDKRFNITLDFLKTHAAPPQTVLDLGVENPFSKIMTSQGYQVENTKGEDLDLDYKIVETYDTKLTTAFEIFEHLLSPMQVLQHIKSDYLFASVPLKLWFASAYRSKTDPWDRHYHEFEDWQFDWLLEKAGWEILDRKKFSNPVKKIGIRPILRHFTPRYYLVHCQKKS